MPEPEPTIPVVIFVAWRGNPYGSTVDMPEEKALNWIGLGLADFADDEWFGPEPESARASVYVPPLNDAGL